MQLRNVALSLCLGPLYGQVQLQWLQQPWVWQYLCQAFPILGLISFEDFLGLVMLLIWSCRVLIICVS